MAKIFKTANFDIWLRKLRDGKARSRILVRIDRLANGHAGDVAAVGEGVSELRMHYGPGYRVYFVKRGEDYVLLCGGDKSTQHRDIEKAKALAGET